MSKNAQPQQTNSQFNALRTKVQYILHICINFTNLASRNLASGTESAVPFHQAAAEALARAIDATKHARASEAARTAVGVLSSAAQV